MTSQTKKFLYHRCVAFIDSHMQGWLASFVSCIHVTSGFDELLHDNSLISKGSMVDSTVAIFVLEGNT